MGRRPKLTHEEAQHIRHLYHRGTTPQGKRYSMEMLARMYRVSTLTIGHVINKTAAYKEKGLDFPEGTKDVCVWEVEDGRKARTSCQCVVYVRDERPSTCAWCNKPVTITDDG